MALAYLLDPAFEITNTAGKPLTGGWLECYVHGTRDKYYCASDFDGTLHPFKVPLDSLGSNVVLAENSLSYDVYIYNRYGGLVMSRYNVIPTAGSGGGGGGSDEYLEWMETEPVSVTDGDNMPSVSEGSMTSDSDGLLVYEGHHYHITNSFTVVPTGTGRNYDTFTVALMFDDDNGPVTLVSRSWDVDNSLTDSNEFEFSYDLVPSADGRVYWAVTGASSFSGVTGTMQVHRIYSGIAALPDTYARKDWVEEQIFSKIDYSALEYNPSAQITGISGSAIGGQVDPNDFIPWSASGQFQPSGSYQPSGDYVYESSYSAFSSNVTNNITSLSSTVTGLSADMSSYLPLSGLQGDGTSITAIEGSAIGGTATGGKTYSGIAPIVVDNTADTIGIQQLTLTVDSSMTSYYSGDSAVLGVNTTAIGSSIVSSKMDASASSLFYSTSNPSGFITNSDLSNYATTAYVDSSVSGKLDASASSNFPTTGDMSSYMAYSSVSGEDNVITSINGSAIGSTGGGVVTAMGTAQTGDSAYVTSLNGLPVSAKTASFAGAATYAYLDGYGEPLDQSANVKTSAMSAYMPYSAVSGDDSIITSINGSAVGGGKVYSGVSPIVVDNTADTISISSRELAVDSSMTSYYSGDSAFIGVHPDYGSSFAYQSSLTSYVPVSASGQFAPSGNYIYESALGWAEV